MVGVDSPGSTLDRLPTGKRAYVAAIDVEGAFRHRLLDLGFVPGALVVPVLCSPDGGLVSYRVKGADIALRREDAAGIRVSLIPSVTEPAPSPDVVTPASRSEPVPAAQPSHPSGRPVPLVALAGNPNTGKSTVFNALTGLRQHVGNWPGKTVARLEGTWMYRGRPYRMVDLPGTYSLLSNSPEEEIARDFLLTGKPDCTVVIADATCLERNLNLAFQIMEITPHVLLCVNLIDQARARGIRVDGERLQELLGIPVVMTCAHRMPDVARLAEHVEQVASGRLTPRPIHVGYSEPLERAIDEIRTDVEHVLPGVSSRWVAVRLLDGADDHVRQWVVEAGLGDRSGRDTETRTACRA